jgi:DNA-binding transcriptional ArsR family regulator
MVTLAQRRPEQPTRDPFVAIADPTRRSILDLIRQQERSAGEIAQFFPVSRPAIAKHMRVLREAGLLFERRETTMRFYSLNAQALQDVDTWLAPYRLFWAARLMDLKRVVEDDFKRQAKKTRRAPGARMKKPSA